MQYVVEVSGNVSNPHKKAYVVDSNNEKKAEEIAKNNFYNEFSANSKTIKAQANKRTIKSILAFVFMAIPIFLSFINWKVAHDSISISPDYLSCLYSVILYSAFVIRFKGFKRTTSSWIDILFCIFIVLLLASFIKTILVSKSFNLLGLIKFDIDTNVLMIVAIIMSWLGLKVVSLSCLAGISLMALFNIISLNLAMGHIYGPIYIICSFIGILLYLSVEPVSYEMINSIKTFTNRSMNNLNNDIIETKNKLNTKKGEKNEE